MAPVEKGDMSHASRYVVPPSLPSLSLSYVLFHVCLLCILIHCRNDLFLSLFGAQHTQQH